MNGRIFSIVFIFSVFSLLIAHSEEQHLWCYECNIDLTQGHKGTCNDPYTPGAYDLVACPNNESHHCHKSIVFYRNILVTVRACILSSEINQYCNYRDHFPLSNIECYFCKENACNDQASFSPISNWHLGLFAIILSLISL